MLFRQLFDHKSSTYTYLLASGPGREAVIIDPVKDQLEQYLRLRPRRWTQERAVRKSRRGHCRFAM